MLLNIFLYLFYLHFAIQIKKNIIFLSFFINQLEIYTFLSEIIYIV